MNEVTSMLLRRMRAPFLLLICVYSISILGMVLIPGVDDDGNVWHMSIFHAFYFVSYTATTIGFGEIPYTLTDAQRLWAIIIVYTSVTSWFYALGKIITLIQDKTFSAAIVRSRFSRNVTKINRPFYLICGFGETGSALVKALTEEHLHTVVIEKDPVNLSELKLNELLMYVPSFAGDASNPEHLELAGIKHKMCRGVIAVTASDNINLKIAITSKLLHPDVPVVCRSEYKEDEENMLSFGTNYIVNPFDTFAGIFEMAMHSPSLHLIYDWLTGVPNTKLTDPVYFKRGHWILCGFGRFGKVLFKHLRDHDLSITIIDPDKDLLTEFRKDPENEPYDFIIGHGTDTETLTQAGMIDAAGIIAGADNDSNNLSIIMTAKAINQDVFIVARQNLLINHKLYDATHAHLIMRHREMLARKIRVIFLAPLLLKFLKLAKKQDPEWANITISRLSATASESRPHLWSVFINQDQTPAIAMALSHGRKINIGHITQDPAANDTKLNCVPLLLIRDDQEILLPEDDIEIKAFDQILFCGTRDIKLTMRWTLNVKRSLNYVMTLTEEPESYIWRKLYRYFNKLERRKTPR